MNILITGGTGFIGSALTQNLLSQGENVTLFCRNPEMAKKRFGSISTVTDLNTLNAKHQFDVIINLAGAPIFDKRWTEARKQILRDSRITLTHQLIAAIERMEIKPSLLISGSAIGIYGDQGDTILTEDSPAIPDFSQQLCADWEAAALAAETLGVRVGIIRTGLVLAHDGGLLQRMLLPFKLGLGGQLGSGKQWMSWIHREDWLAIAKAMIDDPTMQGIYNATAPTPAINLEFTRALAAAISRPALLPVPASLLKLLLGEMSLLVLGSQRVLPERLLEYGFTFKYPTLDRALLQALKP